MYFGNYVIGTKGMSSFSYITNDLELGASINSDNIDELADVILEITEEQEKLKENYIKAQQRVKEKFYWSEIVKPLVEKLNFNTNDER
jgi:glycosyltransferase involved in cell wall biosynthesis